MNTFLKVMESLKKKLGDECEVYARSTVCGTALEMRADWFDGSHATYGRKYAFDGKGFRVMEFVRRAREARDARIKVRDGY